jgi:hypothetical protein
MNSASVHEKPRIRQFNNYWCCKWFLTGCLSRALSEIDPAGSWRDGSKSPRGQIEKLEAHAARLLLGELKRLGAPDDSALIHHGR